MTSLPSLTPSHVAHIAKAKSLDEATQMGIIDRIIDFFKNGVKREAIEKIFNAIQTMQRGTAYDVNAGNKEPRLSFTSIDETERLELFVQLRNMALPEQQHQFQYDIYKNETGGFGVNITIAGESVYKNDDIYESVGDGRLPNLFIAKLQLNLEDTSRANDPTQLIKTLVAFDQFITMQMPTENEKSEPLSPEQKAVIKDEMIANILDDVPSETKAMILATGTSNFGESMRGILNFGYDVLAQAGSQPAPISTPKFADSGFTMLHMNAEKNQAYSALPLELVAHYKSVLITCDKQLNAEQALLSEPENNDLAVNDSNLNASKLQLHDDKIYSHTQLTEAETRALNIIGIPNSILRLM